MRTILLLSALATAACSNDAVHLQHNSTLLNATRGLVLLGEGLGHGAMLDTTCAFDGNAGFVFADVNLPTDTERIGGAHGDLIVGYSAEGVHAISVEAMFRGNLAWDRSRDIPVAGVVDAKATADGAVYLRRAGSDCLVGGHALGSEIAVGSCSDQASLLVDPVGEGRWIHDQGLVRTLQGDPVAHADHATFDRLHRQLLVADGSVVQRIGPSGQVELQVDVRRQVTALADLGTRDGFVAVGEGRSLQIVDGHGFRLASLRLPATESVQVVTSEDGRDLSLVTERESHNYTLADGPPNPGAGLDVIQFSD